MSNTPYFDAYEARRRQQQRTVTNATSTELIGNYNPSRAIEYINIGRSSSGVVSIEGPRFRLRKEYFEGRLIDVTLELQDVNSTLWVNQPEHRVNRNV